MSLGYDPTTMTLSGKVDIGCLQGLFASLMPQRRVTISDAQTQVEMAQVVAAADGTFRQELPGLADGQRLVGAGRRDTSTSRVSSTPKVGWASTRGTATARLQRRTR